MTEQQEAVCRDAFEKWFAAPVPLQRDKNGASVFMTTYNDAWQTWRAAWEDVSPRLALPAPVPVIGQPTAVRAMTIALTGNHSILLWGPRGVGKDTIRRAFPHDAYIRNVMDSCPCGNYSSIVKECTCTEVQLRRWSNRFQREVAHHDINVEVPPVLAKEMLNPHPWVFDDAVAKRVAAARAFGKLHTSAVRDEMGNRLMEMAVRRMSFTYGQFDAVKRVARTIANLDGSPLLQAKHLAEAVQYQTLRRMMDRKEK